MGTSGRRTQADRRVEDPGWLRDMVQANDDKHEEAHSRIRLDHRALESQVLVLKDRLTAIELVLGQNTVTLTDMKDAPIDVGKIVFNPKMVMAIVGLVASILTGNWFINMPLRESQSTTNQALAVMKTQMDADTRLQDERAKSNATELAALKSDLKTGLELRRLEIATVQSTLQQRR